MVAQSIPFSSIAPTPLIGDRAAPAVIECVYHLADWLTSCGMGDDDALDRAAEILRVDLAAVTAVLNRLDSEYCAPAALQ